MVRKARTQDDRSRLHPDKSARIPSRLTLWIDGATYTRAESRILTTKAVQDREAP